MKMTLIVFVLLAAGGFWLIPKMPELHRGLESIESKVHERQSLLDEVMEAAQREFGQP